MSKLYAMPEPKFQELSKTEFVYLHDYHIEAPDEWQTLAEYLTERARVYGEKPIRIVKDTNFGVEAYRIHITNDVITVQTGGERGMRYAMYMLMQATYRKLPTGVIEDYPDMAMRGYLINLRGPMRYAPIENLCSYVRMCGQAKINTILIEYDTRFHHGKYQPKNPWVLTDDEFNKLQATAKAEGIDIIPLIQTYGHLNFLLDQPSLAYLREENHLPDQLCPLHPDALSFSKELIDMYVDRHPGLKYLHIGGDETRQLGKCPRCAEFVKEHGKGGLYTHYINQLIDYVCQKGITPLVYDDMICAHSEAMKELDRRATIVYWDYWTTSDPSPLLVARGGHDWAIVRDKASWDDRNFAGLPDMQREIFKTFGKPTDILGGGLKHDYLERYLPYLGDQVPQYFKAFPYIEYYQDQGFKVIAMPTSLGNSDNYLGAPNQARFTANVRTFAERSIAAGATGMITSDWFAFPECAYPFGIALAGQYSWGMPDYQDGK